VTAIVVYAHKHSVFIMQVACYRKFAHRTEKTRCCNSASALSLLLLTALEQTVEGCITLTKVAMMLLHINDDTTFSVNNSCQ
jgi:hypothetical protein